MNRHILLVEDTTALAQMYAEALSCEGYGVSAVHSGQSLFDALAKDSFAPDLLVLDIGLPDMDGLDILERLRKIRFNAPVIIITGNGSINTAVDSMRLGAADFLVKPFPIDTMIDSVARTLNAAGLMTKAEFSENENRILQQNEEGAAQKVQASRAGFGGFIGVSEPMQRIYDVIEAAAKSNATVFITGESGTGKEICAEAIHRYSKRTGAPFIAINCAAIPRDLLESELFGHVKGAFTNAISEREGAVSMARGGTLFLDEIAEMAPDMQTKLLRFLQNHSYRKVGGNKIEKANVRIVCATNRDPLEEIKKGTLRQDLYYRLHVIPIHMPPLRSRKNDIVDLADYFLKLYAREEGKSFRAFSPEAERVMVSLPWQGNVRELQNIVRGIVVLQEGRIVTLSMLPESLHKAAGLFRQAPIPSANGIQDEGSASVSDISPLWQVERSAIEAAITRCEGNIPRAAALLEISPSTIYRKKMIWDKHGLSPAGLDSAHF